MQSESVYTKRQGGRGYRTVTWAELKEWTCLVQGCELKLRPGWIFSSNYLQFYRRMRRLQDMGLTVLPGSLRQTLDHVCSTYEKDMPPSAVLDE